MQNTKTSSLSRSAVIKLCIGAILAYIILNQGGYFAGGIISVGIAAAILLFGVKPELKTLDLLFLVFALWYLFCSLKPDFDIRYTVGGMLPLVVLMFRFLLPEDKDNAAQLCLTLIKISFYIAILAIAVCMWSSGKSLRLRRLTFPFQYANASGIFFAVMFILSRYAGFEWARKRQYLFFAALVLTQSVGAIGVTVLAEIFLSRDLKKTVAILAFLGVGAIVLHSRVYQSIGTFIERFLQIYDGFVCMTDNPLFGIGAGRWELAKNLYQSGFYDARVVHSSIMQVGVDSGIVGLGLFVVLIAAALRTVRFSNKTYPVCILMILCHSCLDFTFAFTAMGLIIVMLFACGERKDKTLFELKAPVRLFGAVAVLLSLTVLAVGLCQVRSLNRIDRTKNCDSYIEYYESNPLSQNSVSSKEDYATALYAAGRRDDCLKVLENIDVLSSDMVVLKKGCVGDWRGILENIKLQPYNLDLYKTMCYCDDESLRNKSEKMLDEAISSMSFFGKILYKFKGEEIL